MYIILAIFLFLLDQISKYIISGNKIVIIKNYKVAFGYFSANKITEIVFLIIIFFILILIIKSWKTNNWLNKISLSFILGGGISNLLDRITFGYVRDFIDLKIFPVFNIADIFISLGLLIYVYNEVKSKNII